MTWPYKHIRKLVNFLVRVRVLVIARVRVLVSVRVRVGVVGLKGFDLSIRAI